MGFGWKIESEIRAAQRSSQEADAMIQRYLPFIRSETAKFLGGISAEGRDELSIAMFAFYECLQAYEPGRGAFLHLAATAIRNRLIDYARKEQRHQGTLSLDATDGEGETLLQSLAAEDRTGELPERLASRRELEAFAGQLETFGLSLTDVAAACPRQERTRLQCLAVLRYARKNPALLERLVQTRKLPLSQLVQGAGVERKTIERHRNYVVAILLAYTNGYEIIRGQLSQLRGEEETL